MVQTMMDVMTMESTGIPTDFLLKQIENEINAGFVFVAAARNALRQRQTGEAGDALEHAAEVHQQASEQLADSPAARVRAVTHQLSELREAIEWLRETSLPK